MRNILFAIMLIFTLNVFSMNKEDVYKQAISDVETQMSAVIDSMSTIGFERFKGNDENYFLKNLITELSSKKRYKLVLADDQKKLFSSNLQYSEPIYNEKSQSEPGNFTAPKYIVNGKSNYHEISRLFRKYYMLDLEFKVSDLNKAETVVFFNKEYQIKDQISPFYLIIMIILVLITGRYINHISKGYRSRVVVIASISLVLLLIIWYLT